MPRMKIDRGHWPILGWTLGLVGLGLWSVLAQAPPVPLAPPAPPVVAPLVPTVPPAPPGTVTPPAPTDKTAAKPAVDDRAADRTAIDDVAKSFMQAFEKGNADGVVGHMTSGAELIAPDGTTIRGKDDLAKSFTEYFREHPRHAVVAERELLRFLGKDSALDEGIMKVDNGSGEVGLHRYVILYVREDGKWRIGVLRNDEIDKGSLMDLEWLIGSWKARRADVEVDTTYSWMGKKNFIKMDFTIKEKDKTHSGMQIIGLDPATGTLRTWTFEDSGAIGSGSCARDGSRWIFENQASLADGSVMTASNILTPINRDAFTWQPINLAVDDVPLANLPPVKVTRVKAEKPVK